MYARVFHENFSLAEAKELATAKNGFLTISDLNQRANSANNQHLL